jgi:5-(carboxyamino)imidazole ribonucleotide mutase
MPNGVPVATVALNAAKNAGILAAQMVGAFDETIQANLQTYKNSLAEKVKKDALALGGEDEF